MKAKPKILLTNDDGIDADSIWLLKKELASIADCEIAAPRYPKSASGHSVSLTDRIRCEKISREGFGEGYGVDGTPADAVKFALAELFKEVPFDLVISGINLGPNTGVSVYYSGTVGAAREAVVSGIPAFAVSLNAFLCPDYSYAIGLSRQIASGYLSGAFPRDFFLNVNIPAVPASAIKGIRWTKQAPSRFVEFFERVEEASGSCYMLKGQIEVLTQDGGTDQEALESRYVSITPLMIDTTHYPYLEKTKKLVEWLNETSRPETLKTDTDPKKE